MNRNNEVIPREQSKKRTRRSYRNKSNLNPDSGVRPKKRKKRQIENVKEKFRKSKEWKDFRSQMAKLFNHKDYITGRRLVKGFNVHHMRTEQDEDAYCDISKQEEFIPLNSYTHKMLHYLFVFYQKDKTIMDRMKEILDKMCELKLDNYDDEPVDGEYAEPECAEPEA